jgi:uncharacterized DUF497 family protein
MRKATLEWDEEKDKDKENQAKHGISFLTAQQAFLDPHRVSRKTLRIAVKKTGITAWDVSMKVF